MMRSLRLKKIKRVRVLCDKIFKSENVNDVRYMIKQMPMVVGYEFFPLQQGLCHVALSVQSEYNQEILWYSTDKQLLVAFKEITKMYYQFWLNNRK